MTPEGKVKDEVKKYLTERGAYFFMPVQSGYGAATLDFLVCLNGKFIALETKAPGKKLTARQKIIAEQIADAGGYVIRVDGTSDDWKTILDFP